MEHPTPEHVLAASMYFDLRAVTGTSGLADTLRDVIRDEAPRRRHFLSALARDVAARDMPITVFGRIAVRRRGPHRGTVDVKGAGGLQLVGAGRVHALELAAPETSTAARFQAAGAAGAYSAAETAEILDAHEHLLRLRLCRQLACIAAGAPPDNDVDPARLTRRDAVLLRDAFRTVAHVQAVVADRFRAELMG
jgi:CBS domain-containing protein